MRLGSVLGCALAGLVAVAGPAFAGTPEKSEDSAAAGGAPAMSLSQRIKEFSRLLDEHKSLMAEKKYAEAAVVSAGMVAVLPPESLGHYNHACSLARLGKPEEAFAELARAVELGYAKPTLMTQDEDVASLRDDKRFAALVEDAKLNERADGAPYEKGDDIPGVKTLEGFPDGGLRWRLRMSPDATKEKPERLIVWLHPIAASLNRVIEGLAPRFIKQGFAVVVFTHKPWKPWTTDDVPRIAKALEDVAKTDGLDAARPILMGASLGGQMAFNLWSANAEAYGGLIVNAAFPARVVSGVQLGVLPLPPDDVAKTVPIFALVGLKDGGVRIWQKSEPTLRQAGVPLTLRYIPGKAHVWLFDDARLAELDKWLAQVAAGKLPADPPPPAAETKP